jgi:integrase
VPGPSVHSAAPSVWLLHGEGLAHRVSGHLIHLVGERRVSRSYPTQAVSALRFLIEAVYGEARVADVIPRPKRERQLPTVLSKDEMSRFLDALQHPKQRALVMLAYSSGLRVSEVVRLRPEDLDVLRGLLHVRRGKGSKDRYTLLSQRALEHVHVYRDAFRPQQWLFPANRRTATTRRVRSSALFRTEPDARDSPKGHASYSATLLRDASTRKRYGPAVHPRVAGPHEQPNDRDLHARGEHAPRRHPKSPG